MADLAWPTVVPILSDGVVTLRGWEAADADAVFAACQDAAIQRYMSVPVPFRSEHAIDLVTLQAQQHWASHEAAPFAITTAGGDQAVGSCGLVGIDVTDLVAQVVCAVDPRFREQGVALRAGRLLCDWALADLGLARLEFFIEPDNTPSRAAAERLGGKLEGILRSRSLIRGARRDIALYALVSEDARVDQPK